MLDIQKKPVYPFSQKPTLAVVILTFESAYYAIKCDSDFWVFRDWSKSIGEGGGGAEHLEM